MEAKKKTKHSDKEKEGKNQKIQSSSTFISKLLQLHNLEVLKIISQKEFTEVLLGFRQYFNF